MISNSQIVPAWANWDEFRRLEALGLTMYGQMTAGSWIYIGTQGILQGTYETFASCADKNFGRNAYQENLYLPADSAEWAELSHLPQLSMELLSRR